MFVAERTAMQKLIDQQVQLTQSGLVELGDSTGDLPRVSGSAEQRTSSGLFTGPVSYSGGTSSGLRRDLLEATQGLSRQSASRIEAPAAPARPRRSFVIALALAASVGAAAAWLVPRKPASDHVRVDDGAAAQGSQARGPSDRQAPAATAQAPFAAEPVQPSATTPEALQGATVIIDLKVWPPDAQVTLDGAPLSLPFSGEFRKSAAVHHLEASAQGHRFLRRSVVFEQDQVIELALEPLPLPPQPARRPQVARAPSAPAPSSPPVVARPPEEPAPGTDLPARAARKRGTLDMADPYATE
jgi:hypothetical protein